MSEQLYVLAGNLRQAHRYCRERGLSPSLVRLPVNPQDLRGIHSPTVILTGTFSERRDWYEWTQMLGYVGATVREEPTLREVKPVKPSRSCANGDGRPVQPPSKVICKECLAETTTALEEMLARLRGAEGAKE